MRHDTLQKIFRVQVKCWFLLGIFSLSLPGGLRENSEAEPFMTAELGRRWLTPPIGVVMVANLC